MQGVRVEPHEVQVGGHTVIERVAINGTHRDAERVGGLRDDVRACLLGGFYENGRQLQVLQSAAQRDDVARGGLDGRVGRCLLYTSDAAESDLV